MPNENVDFSEEVGYNTDNDANVEIFKMDEHEPINDLECTHEVLIPNPDDTIGDAIYHGCANRQCGLGWYLK